MNCNPSIKCAVASCAHHSGQNACTLTEICVGCTSADVCTPACTECASFAPGDCGRTK